MALTAAFPTVSQGIKQDGDPFTFKNAESRDSWMTVRSALLARHARIGDSPENAAGFVGGIAGMVAVETFAATTEKCMAKNGRNFNEACRSAYTYLAQTQHDAPHMPTLGELKRQLNGTWVHDDAFSDTLHPVKAPPLPNPNGADSRPQ